MAHLPPPVSGPPGGRRPAYKKCRGPGSATSPYRHCAASTSSSVAPTASDPRLCICLAMMMLPSTGGRTPMLALAASAGLVLFFILGVMAWHSPSRMPLPGSFRSSTKTPAAQKAESPTNGIMRLLFDQMRISPTAPFIRQPNGSHITLPPHPRYKKRLGTDVLILDLETRPLASTEAFEKDEYHWENINHVSGGVFNHYAYALVHDYDYKFVHAHEFEDRHATWIKPSALANLIKDYKFIVFLDADAAFRFLHVPIEWMLNYWNIQPQHSVIMAKDPWDPASPQFNSDRFNRTYTNTGFMVVQNNDKVMEILKAWHECPEDTRYPECSQWKQPKFHEQSAFGEYIRYDYEPYIKELDCGEANGYPGVEISNCQGRFVRHHWFHKDDVKIDFSENVMNALTLGIQETFAENLGGVIVEQKENVIHG